MTRIVVVNPNTTAAMTEGIARAAAAAAGAGTQIEARTAAHGPASIEGYVDEAYAVPALLQAIVDDRSTPDAYVIACFDDTGLDAARCLADAPVVGIGEAAFHVATLVAHRFGVVTTLARSVATIEHNLLRYGMASRCSGVRAADVPVLDLHVPGSDARERIGSQIEAALRDDGADGVVLGCAGMAGLAAELSARYGVPVIDGVAAAVALAESLARLGLRTSRLGPYAPPRDKPYAGRFGGIAPWRQR